MLEEPNVAAVLVAPVVWNNRECRRSAPTLHLGIHKCGKGTERNGRIIGRIRYPLALGVLDEYLTGKAIFGSPQLRAIVIDVEPGGVYVV